MTPNTDTLSNYALIKVSGKNSKSFLQGQFTVDITKIEQNSFITSCYCDIKGKIISFFRLFCNNNLDYFIFINKTIKHIMINELSKYSKLSKVKIEEIDNNLPFKIENNYKKWVLNNINNNIIDIYGETSGKFFIHDLSLQYTNSVSFTKGCYRGQEIVARMQHRGNIKRALYKGCINIIVTNINNNNIIYLDKVVGSIISSIEDLENNKTIFLAVLNKQYSKELLKLNNNIILSEIQPAYGETKEHL